MTGLFCQYNLKLDILNGIAQQEVRRTHVKRMGGFKLCYKLKEDLPAARCKKMNEVYVCIAWEIGTEKHIYGLLCKP